MIDIKIIRENPDALREGLKRRQMDTSIVETLTQLDELRRKLLTDAEKLKAERNKVSKEISATKEKTEREAKIDAMREVGRKIDELNEKVKAVEEELSKLIATVPNLPDNSVPLGKDEKIGRASCRERVYLCV